jgi:hypothetical protein
MTKKTQKDDAVKVDPKAKAEVSKALTKLKESEKEVAIKTHDDYLFATSKLFDVKEELKNWEARNAAFTEPAKAILKAAKETFGPVIKYLEGREGVLKGEVSRYLVACEDKRQELLRSAQKVGRVNKTKGREMIAMAEQQAPPKVGGISVTSGMKYEVFDETIVPEEFFKMVRVLDHEKLEAHLQTGEDVDGVRVTAAVNIRVTVGQREE